MPVKKVAILGGGSFGTVIANIIARNGYRASLWMRDNEQARFHSRQGLILFLIELLAILLLIPGLSSLIWKTVLIVALGASVAGIIFGLQGKMYKLPFIGDIADKLKL